MIHLLSPRKVLPRRAKRLAAASALLAIAALALFGCGIDALGVNTAPVPAVAQVEP